MHLNHGSSPMPTSTKNSTASGSGAAINRSSSSGSRLNPFIRDSADEKDAGTRFLYSPFARWNRRVPCG